MRAAKIVRVTPIGTKKTIDIEVDSPSHIFYGNGIATSNSHSVSYAIRAYQSAYLKAHYPVKYFKNWLRNAEDKQEYDVEIKQLVMASKAENIVIKGPSIKYLEENFFWRDGAIWFGICNVKSVGPSQLKKMQDLSLDKETNWLRVLVDILPKINSKSVTNLITAGAFSHYGLSRSQMLHEFNSLTLTDKEMLWLSQNLDIHQSLVENLKRAAINKKEGGACIASRVPKVLDIIKKIENPGRSLKDNPIVFSKAEEDLLGVHVSHNELDACADAGMANSTCKEVNSGNKDKVLIAAVIKEVKYHKTKKGDQMAFLTVEDDTAELENVVVFPKVYDLKHDIIYPDSTVLISGQTQDNGSTSFIVETMYSI